MNIKDKTIEDVAARVQELLDKYQPKQPYGENAIQATVDKDTHDALIELLSIRGQLAERFKGVINLIDSIETNIKEKKLPIGTYGVVYPLKVSMVQQTVVFTDKVVKAIEESGDDIQKYMVLDLKNTYVADLIKSNPKFTTKEPNYTKHKF